MYSLENEYKLMTDILSGQHKDELFDLARIAHDGHSPVTYGDTSVCPFKGTKTPVEIILTHKADHLTNQSLDYIF